jgi:hypothetical protein
MSGALTTEPFEVEILIEGHLEGRSGWFEGMTLTSQPDGSTLITGQIADQAALFAFISRIRDLGLRLISIKRGS